MVGMFTPRPITGRTIQVVPMASTTTAKASWRAIPLGCTPGLPYARAEEQDTRETTRPASSPQSCAKPVHTTAESQVFCADLLPYPTVVFDRSRELTVAQETAPRTKLSMTIGPILNSMASPTR